ncbi:MAG: SBBP repeat-containing protein [Chloroflexi bacterium]|nr:SBBP repeat-containing protein [Chloroflexota bacterium]
MHTRRALLWKAAGLGLLVSVACSGGEGAIAPTTVPNPGDAALLAPAKAELESTLGQLPLHFEVNVGQTDHQIEFLSRVRGYSLFLASGEATLVMKRSSPDHVDPARNADTAASSQPGASLTNEAPALLRMRPLGASAESQAEGLEPLPGISNYFMGSDPEQWQTNIPTYASVKYRDVYPGVDLIYYGDQGRLEFDFVVDPGRNPSTINLAFDGADEARIDSEGDLVLGVHGETLRLSAPSIYQEIDGVRRVVPGGYDLSTPPNIDGTVEVGFSVDDYDSGRPLIIDPVLEYSSYIGWSGVDAASDITLDAAGNIYLTGSADSVASSTVTFLGVSAGIDGFIAKLNPDGSTMIYTTFFGGSGIDGPAAIALDSSGGVIVGGYTTSTDFPATNESFQIDFAGNTDGFVLNLHSSGGTLSYATYLGGSDQDVISDIAVAGSGDVYVVGKTSSANFPVLNSIQATLKGSKDAFITFLDLDSSNANVICYLGSPKNDCADLIASTYLGGSNVDDGHGIALSGNSGQAYVTGQTCSNNFPGTAGGFDASANGGCDGFVAGVLMGSSSGILIYSTYLGGTSFDLARSIIQSPAGGYFITGETLSNDFPVKSAAQAQHGDSDGQYDVFVTHLFTSTSNTADDCTISGLDYQDCNDLRSSTYLGGSEDDYGPSIATDSTGIAYVTGQTCSPNFPLASPLAQNSGQGINVGADCDAFVTKLTPNGSGLAYSTYLGGSSSDSGNGIFVDGFGVVYVAGGTSSGNFPEVNPLQASGGGQDAFVAKITVPCTDGGGAYAYTIPNVIDTVNDCLIGTLPAMFVTGQAVSTDDSQLYVADLQTASFIDLATNQVDDLMPAGVTQFQSAAVSPDGTRLYVTDHDDADPSEVHVFDTHTKQFIESIPYGAGDASGSVSGSGIVVHPNGEKLYVVGNHAGTHVFSINLGTKQVTNIDYTVTNSFKLWDAAITPDGKWLYVAQSSDNDTVAVIDATTDTWVEDIAVEDARYVAITPNKVPGHEYLVYVTAETFENPDLTVIDTDDNAIVHVEPDAGGGNVEVTPDATKVYVITEFVKVIDVATNQWVKNVPGPPTASMIGSFIGPQDRDADGIIDQVDIDPIAASDAFGDGTSSGTVIDRADQNVTVWDAFGNGLYANARGGTQTAQINACGLDIYLDQNDAIKIQCGSLKLEVTNGAVEVRLDADTLVALSGGSEVKISETASGEYLVENRGRRPLMITDGVGATIDTIAEANSWTTNGTVRQTLSGVLTLQSVESTSSFAQIAPRLTLMPTDGGTPVVVIPNPDGSFEFASLLPWSYEISVSAAGFMVAAKVEFPVGGSPVVLPNVQLRAGLVDRDDGITIRDLSAITASFGQAVVARTDGLGRIVDLNADGVVDILDVSAAASNFGSASPMVWP